MPSVSVIVPVYGVEKYISRCIDSVCAQTFTDWELILVDDGSKDKSGLICDEYALKDVRIQVIHQKNGGVSSARNTGMHTARGTYITFCDGDDYYLSAALEELMALARQTDADLVSYNYLTEVAGTKKGGSQIQDREYLVSSIKERVELISAEVFQNNLGWSVCTDLFKREIIEKNNLSFCTTCGNYAEDIGFALKYLFYARRVVGCAKRLYIYDRTREESMMNRSVGLYKLNELNAMSMDVEAEFRRNTTQEEFARYYSVLFFQIMSISYYQMLWDRKGQKLKDEIKKIVEQKWYTKQSRNATKIYNDLKRSYGKNEALDQMALSRYCVHRSYLLYRIDGWITYHVLKRLIK